jgi:hypothetical protein
VSWLSYNCWTDENLNHVKLRDEEEDYVAHDTMGSLSKAYMNHAVRLTTVHLLWE